MLVIAGSIILWRQHSGGKPQGPVILFEGRTYDAGTIRDPSGRTIRHRFPFHNSGSEILHVTGVRTTCGCAVVGKREMTVQPGETDFIEVTLSLGALGRKKTQIYVTSNAPSSPDQLGISATCVPMSISEAIPKQIDFGEFSADKASAMTLSVHAFRQEQTPIRIRDIQSETGRTAVTLKDVFEPNYRSQFGYYRTTFRLEVIPKAGGTATLADNITVTFDPPLVPALTVPVKGQVLPKWSVRPERVFFVRDLQRRPIDPPARIVSLRSSAGQPFSCAGIANPFQDWLEVAVQENPTQGGVQIMLRAKRWPDAMSLDGQVNITVQTEPAGSESVAIPISLRTMEADR
jgi:hypothetical protein